MFHQHALIMSMFLVPTISHISLVIQYIPCSLAINVVIYILTKPKCQSLFLGFHTWGLYVHNDVMLAFGTPKKQILIEPIFAQWIQSAHGKALYGFDVLLSSPDSPAFNAGQSLWLPGWLDAMNNNNNSLFSTIDPGALFLLFLSAIFLANCCTNCFLFPRIRQRPASSHLCFVAQVLFLITDHSAALFFVSLKLAFS